MFELTAYCDESGTHDTSELVVVAGYLAEADQWIEFEQEWLNALDDFGLRRVGFHMTDFANQSPPHFDGWPEDVRRSRLNRLLDIISAHVVGSIGAVVPRALFDSQLSARTQRALGGPYGYAANTIFAITHQYLHPEAWVAYVLEDGAVGKGEILKVYENNVRNGGDVAHRIRSLRFENKCRFVALQASDILAYELYRQFPKEGTESSVRYPMNRVAEVPHKWVYADEPGFASTARVMAKLGYV